VTASRRRLDPAARRLEIVEAAERVIRRLGASARVEDVVREAGAAKGTFYLYFPTWEALLACLRDRTFAAFDTRFPVPAIPEADWLTVVNTLATGFVEFVLELEGLHEAIFHGALAKTAEPGSSDSATLRIAALLRAGAAAGVLAQLDPEPTARLIFAVLHETVDAIAQGEDRARAIGAMRAILTRTLTPAPSA